MWILILASVWLISLAYIALIFSKQVFLDSSHCHASIDAIKVAISSGYNYNANSVFWRTLISDLCLKFSLRKIYLHLSKIWRLKIPPMRLQFRKLLFLAIFMGISTFTLGMGGWKLKWLCTRHFWLLWPGIMAHSYLVLFPGSWWRMMVSRRGLLWRRLNDFITVASQPSNLLSDVFLEYLLFCSKFWSRSASLSLVLTPRLSNVSPTTPHPTQINK